MTKKKEKPVRIALTTSAPADADGLAELELEEGRQEGDLVPDRDVRDVAADAELEEVLPQLDEPLWEKIRFSPSRGLSCENLSSKGFITTPPCDDAADRSRAPRRPGGTGAGRGWSRRRRRGSPRSAPCRTAATGASASCPTGSPSRRRPRTRSPGRPRRSTPSRPARGSGRPAPSRGPSAAVGLSPSLCGRCGPPSAYLPAIPMTRVISVRISPNEPPIAARYTGRASRRMTNPMPMKSGKLMKKMLICGVALTRNPSMMFSVTMPMTTGAPSFRPMTKILPTSDIPSRTRAPTSEAPAGSRS